MNLPMIITGQNIYFSLHWICIFLDFSENIGLRMIIITIHGLPTDKQTTPAQHIPGISPPNQLAPQPSEKRA